jgi:hypothetical protein
MEKAYCSTSSVLENVEPFAFCRLASRVNRPNVFYEDTLAWAQATGEGEEDENKVIHRDSNGVILELVIQ